MLCVRACVYVCVCVCVQNNSLVQVNHFKAYHRCILLLFYRSSRHTLERNSSRISGKSLYSTPSPLSQLCVLTILQVHGTVVLARSRKFRKRSCILAFKCPKIILKKERKEREGLRERERESWKRTVEKKNLGACPRGSIKARLEFAVLMSWGWDTSVGRALGSLSKGCTFDSGQEQWENFFSRVNFLC